MSPVLRVSTHIYGVSKDIGKKYVHFSTKPRHGTPQIDCFRKMIPLLRVSTHIYGVSQEIDGKTFIFRVNLGMWPSNQSSQKNKPCSEGFNTHLWCFQGHRWENVHLSPKPRHVTPQIDCLRKTISVLRVSTHIYAVFEEVDGNMFILRVNLGMWLSNQSPWKNEHCCECFNTHLWGFSGDR